jgi:DNA-damage-inducible protein D
MTAWLSATYQQKAESPGIKETMPEYGEVAERNSSLSATAKGAYVLTSRDFAIYKDSGYRGLNDGATARDIAARKGLSKGQHILDWMGSEELAANWFRITLTEQKLRNDPTIATNEGGQSGAS